MVTTQNSHFIQSCKVTSLQQLFCLVLTNKRNKRKNTSKTVLVVVGHKPQYNYNTTNHSTIKTIKTQNTIYHTKCDRHKHNCTITKLRQIKVKITCWVIVKSSTSSCCSKIHSENLKHTQESMCYQLLLLKTYLTCFALLI